MYLVAIGWMYVVLMMAVVEALSPVGTVLGALITFVFYGLLPVSIIVYIMGTPGRKRARRQAEQAEQAELEASAAADPAEEASAAPPDGGGQAAGDTVSPEGKKV